MSGSSAPPLQAQLAPPPDCREFTAPITVDGEPREAVGQACQQPDGSWRVVQSAPGAAPQVYTLPPQAIVPYPYPAPWEWADPWLYGLPFLAGGPVFFADGFHRFHRDDGRRRGRREPGGAHEGGHAHGGRH